MRAIAIFLVTFLVVTSGCTLACWGLDEGELVPDLEVTDLAGEEVVLSDYLAESEFVVIECLNVYCHTCREAVPEMNEVSAYCASKGIPMFGIALGANADEVRTFIERFDARYPVFPDPDKTVIDLFDLQRIPTLDIVDPSRTLRHRHVGEITREQFVRILGDVIRGQRRTCVEKDCVAPTFSLPGLTEEIISLKDLGGKKVLLAFFSGLSDDVVAQVEILNKAQRTYEDEGVTVLSVFSDAPAESLSEFKEKHDLQFPTLIDQKSEGTKPYREMAFPHVWIINEAGRVRFEKQAVVSYDELVEILGNRCDLAAQEDEEETEYLLQQVMPEATSFNRLFLGGKYSWEYEAFCDDRFIGLVRRTCRRVWCPVCKDVHFVYGLDTDGQIVRMFMVWPVEHCRGEQPIDSTQEFKQQILGHSITDTLTWNQGIYGLSGSTNSAKEILEGINETLEVFRIYKNADFMPKHRKQVCFANMHKIHEAVLRYNEEHPDDPMTSLDLEKLKRYFLEGEVPHCPLDGTYVLTDWGDTKAILCTFHGVDLEHHGIALE